MIFWQLKNGLFGWERIYESLSTESISSKPGRLINMPDTKSMPHSGRTLEVSPALILGVRIYGEFLTKEKHMVLHIQCQNLRKRPKRDRPPKKLTNCGCNKTCPSKQLEPDVPPEFIKIWSLHILRQRHMCAKQFPFREHEQCLYVWIDFLGLMLDPKFWTLLSRILGKWGGCVVLEQWGGIFQSLPILERESEKEDFDAMARPMVQEELNGICQIFPLLPFAVVVIDVGWSLEASFWDINSLTRNRKRICPFCRTKIGSEYCA